MSATRDFCIFCKSLLDNSDEHIIPQSINGTLHSKKLICHDCNSNYFGTKIDPSIKKSVNPLLVLLGWKNANSLKGEDINNKPYSIGKGLDIRSVRPTKEETNIDERTIISIEGDAKNTLQMFIKSTEKLIKSGKILTHLSIQESKNTTPYIKTKWEIDISIDLIILLNKIALEFYSFNDLEYSVIETLCKRVRGYDTSLNNIIFCNKENETRDFSSDEISHLIILKSDNDTKSLHAYIEIFNLICCSVTIDDNYNGDEINLTYYQDALTGERFQTNVNLKTKLSSVTGIINNESDFSFLKNDLSERLRTRDFNKELEIRIKLLIKNLEEKEEKGELSAEQSNEEYIQESAYIVAELTTFDYPYIIEDTPDEENDDYNFIHSNFREKIIDDVCKQYEPLIGSSLQTDEGIYSIDSFFKMPFVVKRNKKLIKLYFKLIKEETEQVKYIEARTLIISILEALEP